MNTTRQSYRRLDLLAGIMLTMIAAGAGAAYAQGDNTDLRARGVSAVYTLTNGGFNNEVIVYHRSEDGTRL